MRIHPADFARNASRFALGELWSGMCVLLAAVVWALWLPALVISCCCAGQFAVAIAWALVPSVFLGAWYGWARAILAPIGIYAIPAESVAWRYRRR